MRVVSIVLLLASSLEISSSIAPPCFAMLSPRQYEVIEPQLDTLNSNFYSIFNPCWMNISAQALERELCRAFVFTYTYGTNDGLCVHVTVRPSALTRPVSTKPTGATDGRHLFRKYYPILYPFVFPFEPFVPHTRWSGFYKNCLPLDGGLIIDHKYNCEPDHENIVPWQNINDMSEETILKYITLFDATVDHEFVRQHNRIDHNESVSFFMGHRQYLACFEKQLSRHGIPMPYWSPDTTIPPLLQGVKRSPVACLQSVLCSEGWFDLPLYTTNISIEIPASIHQDTICQHKTLISLHAAISPVWHAQVHRITGGSFILVDGAAALLFFPFHNYIDKLIFKYWEDHCWFN